MGTAMENSNETPRGPVFRNANPVEQIHPQGYHKSSIRLLLKHGKIASVFLTENSFDVAAPETVLKPLGVGRQQYTGRSEQQIVLEEYRLFKKDKSATTTGE